MQLPRTILFCTFPFFRRIFFQFMKIIGSRFRLRGRRQQPAVQDEEKRKEVAVVEQKFKKKALLIGVQQVRTSPEVENDALEVPLTPLTPLTPGTPTASKRKARRKAAKSKKVSNARILNGPHPDVAAMKKLLIETYNYDENDITVLIDDDNPDHVQPTRENILDASDRLIADARENDRFFFHFSGHSTQEDTDDIEEEDRKNEFIVASDGQTIKDDELRLHLVKPLPPKSSLIAVFDSCHSGSLLDLKHFRCNQVYVPWLNRGQRRTNSLWYANQRRAAKISTRNVQQIARINNQMLKWTQTSIDQLMMSPAEAKEYDVKQGPVISKQKTSISIITDSIPEPTWLDSASPIQRCTSPEMLYCSGDCRENPIWQRDVGEQADVISLSSSGDGQRSWEAPDGTSMTQALVQILTNDPHPSLHNLLTLVSHDLHKFYLRLHLKAREYRKQIQAANIERLKKGKKARKGDSVEMNDFQNPQLSSDRPLDMSRTWYP